MVQKTSLLLAQCVSMSHILQSHSVGLETTHYSCIETLALVANLLVLSRRVTGLTPLEFVIEVHFFVTITCTSFIVSQLVLLWLQPICGLACYYYMYQLHSRSACLAVAAANLWTGLSDSVKMAKAVIITSLYRA